MPNKKTISDLTILIVDDQSFLRLLIKDMLRDLRCKRVLEAENGADAISVLEENNVDLLLCDIDMKPVNGFQLVKAVRAELTDASYDIPIIMLTGHSEEHYVQTAIDLNINGFIIKPVSPERLLKNIDQAISSPQITKPIKRDDSDLEIVIGKTEKKESEGERTETGSTETADQLDMKMRMLDRLVTRKLEDVEEGSILAQDIFDSRGRKLLRKGVTITEGYLVVLKLDNQIKEILVLE